MDLRRLTMVYGLLSIVRFGYKKSRPWLGRLFAFTQVLFLHSHLCHPNHKQVLNNKDRKKDDNKGEAEDRVHLAVGISPDYRQKQKSVKGLV